MPLGELLERELAVLEFHFLPAVDGNLAGNQICVQAQRGSRRRRWSRPFDGWRGCRWRTLLGRGSAQLVEVPRHLDEVKESREQKDREEGPGVDCPLPISGVHFHDVRGQGWT